MLLHEQQLCYLLLEIDARGSNARRPVNWALIADASRSMRIPIVDDRGSLVGIVAQADIVRKARDGARAEETVQQISEPSGKHAT